MLCLFFSAYIMTGYRDDIKQLSPSSMLCLFFSAYIMTGYRDDIKHLFPLLCTMSLFLCLHYDRIQGMILITLFPLLCYDTGMILSTLFPSSICLFFSAYIMTGYRDDIKHTLPSSMLCLFFSAYIMTGYRDDKAHSSLFYAMSLFSAYIMTGYRDDTLKLHSFSLFYDTGMILSTLFPLLCYVSFSAYIMTGYRDDIKHSSPLLCYVSLFSAYIMTGYRDDIKHTLPSSMLCLFSLLTL
ncbi:unnamed protein product [Acanthosepion pharaonis]|uniref:Uncharacterized protein n=1 Tax=Acanthosepion pharaonis TaxID=158019 RepID=A0A812BMQ6_ACAPH|nr:unnamed protein product [Sepia pharaonis]